MMVSPDDVLKIMASSACEAHTLTMVQTVKSQTIGYADNRPLQPLGTRTLSKYQASAPTLAPTAKTDSPVSVAAIVIGCVGFAVAGAAIAFAMSKNAAPKIAASSKVAVDSPAAIQQP